VAWIPGSGSTSKCHGSATLLREELAAAISEKEKLTAALANKEKKAGRLCFHCFRLRFKIFVKFLGIENMVRIGNGSFFKGMEVGEGGGGF
jgi:hypothetical protein